MHHGSLPEGKAFEAELKKLAQDLLEALMGEERAMYLETHPTSANGYYTRDLLTSYPSTRIPFWFRVTLARHGKGAGSEDLWKSR
jgi:hypothetical protein